MNLDNPINFIDALKVKGLKVAIDDFGKSHSSFINLLAHTLGKKTIDEFFESAATANLLRTIGVDFVQGYYIAKPQPLESLLLPNQSKPPNKINSGTVYLIQYA